MLHYMPNVKFHGFSILNTIKGTDVRPHAKTEYSEEEQQESENGFFNVNISGSTNICSETRHLFTQFCQCFGQTLSKHNTYCV